MAETKRIQQKPSEYRARQTEIGKRRGSRHYDVIYAPATSDRRRASVGSSHGRERANKPQTRLNLTRCVLNKHARTHSFPLHKHHATSRDRERVPHRAAPAAAPAPATTDNFGRVAVTRRTSPLCEARTLVGGRVHYHVAGGGRSGRTLHCEVKNKQILK